MSDTISDKYYFTFDEVSNEKQYKYLTSSRYNEQKQKLKKKTIKKIKLIKPFLF